MCHEDFARQSGPIQLRGLLAHHETFSTIDAGFGSYKNGALLRAAEDAGFEVLVTADKTMRYKRNLANRNIAVICLSANSWKVIGPNAAIIVAAVEAAKPGTYTEIDCGRFFRLKRALDDQSVVMTTAFLTLQCSN